MGSLYIRATDALELVTEVTNELIEDCYSATSATKQAIKATLNGEMASIKSLYDQHKKGALHNNYKYVGL